MIANVSRSLPEFGRKTTKKLFLKFFGKLITAKSLGEAAEVWRDILRVFTSKRYSTDVAEACEAANAEEIPSGPRSDIIDAENISDGHLKGLRTRHHSQHFSKRSPST